MLLSGLSVVSSNVISVHISSKRSVCSSKPLPDSTKQSEIERPVCNVPQAGENKCSHRNAVGHTLGRCVEREADTALSGVPGMQFSLQCISQALLLDRGGSNQGRDARRGKQAVSLSAQLFEATSEQDLPRTNITLSAYGLSRSEGTREPAAQCLVADRPFSATVRYQLRSCEQQKEPFPRLVKLQRGTQLLQWLLTEPRPVKSVPGLLR